MDNNEKKLLQKKILDTINKNSEYDNVISAFKTMLLLYQNAVSTNNMNNQKGGMLPLLFPDINRSLLVIDDDHGHIIPWVQNLLLSIPISEHVTRMVLSGDEYEIFRVLNSGENKMNIIEFLLQQLRPDEPTLSKWLCPIIWHSLLFTNNQNDPCCMNIPTEWTIIPNDVNKDLCIRIVRILWQLTNWKIYCAWILYKTQANILSIQNMQNDFTQEIYKIAELKYFEAMKNIIENYEILPTSYYRFEIVPK